PEITEPEITEPEITEEFHLGEKEIIPAEEITVTGEEITVTGEEIPIPEEDTAVTEEEITVREEEIAVPEEEIEQPEAGIAKPDDGITAPVEETAGEKSPEEETIQEIPSETDYADETVSKTEEPEVLPEEIQLISETPVESIPAEELDEEVRRRIEELEELAKLRDELQKEAVLETGNVEMQVFEKLIDESETETETETETAEIQEIIIHDPEGFEPASLTEALQEVDLESPSRHFESFDNIKDENVKSYDDVFDAAEEQAVPQFSTEEDKKLTPRSYLKFFLYLFFIFLLATFSFYVYKKILMVPGSSGVVDTAGTVISDSLKSALTEVDSAEMQEQEISVLEDIEVESSGDIIYRKMNEEYRIQISVFQKLADAEQFITNLKEKDFEAKIERADLPMGKTEYRIVVGPFSTLDEAKSYYNNKSMILNFIKVLTPANTGLHLM
ncbi:MAG: SPOR domain-containing protein, partial [Ignavibacteria bacterium]|nr:SPOR domain-containing protein [Ignavibacteria bacterium]